MRGKTRNQDIRISLEKAIKVKEKYALELMSIPGVVGVGVGGKEECAKIIVNVIKLTESLKNEIPEELEGVPVEVVETGVLKALGDR